MIHKIQCLATELDCIGSDKTSRHCITINDLSHFWPVHMLMNLMVGKHTTMLMLQGVIDKALRLAGQCLFRDQGWTTDRFLSFWSFDAGLPSIALIRAPLFLERQPLV